MSAVEWTVTLGVVSVAVSAGMAVATFYLAWNASKTLVETRKSGKLEELRQTLENVYAPLYDAVCQAAGGTEEFSRWLDERPEENLRIAQPSLNVVIKVFSQYSHLTSERLHSNWIKMNKAGIDTYGRGQPWSKGYQVDLGLSKESIEFCQEVKQEYEKLVRQYRDLTGS